MNEHDSFSQTASDLLGVNLTSHQIDAFQWYANELRSWNQRCNLTAITDPDEINIKHFVDSLSCLQVERFRPPGNVIDVGTGAGFPGIPLKIVYPQFRITLVESIGKKMEFCRHVIRSLDLDGIDIVQARAEHLGKNMAYRERYDWAIARAVAILPVLLEYLLPFIKLGGGAIVQKGETGPAEVHLAEKALSVLGGEIKQVLPVELPRVTETRYLIVVDKVACTPEKFPRKPGIPAKRPLN
ncbi:MAG: 16S rRNA (guanine(527)-N(7))-methyltransferase RsmG [Anaerolineales bacterium]|nr:16S rRNA (guanine(527)-N(7))-methyltransferase RsmG [Anaerolineales bacterium]HUS84298.1 16S rRNA (guanine(527)-N(7))-methyltransferase RsmG [Anaerolineales bacterium]